MLCPAAELQVNGTKINEEDTAWVTATTEIILRKETYGKLQAEIQSRLIVFLSTLFVSMHALILSYSQTIYEEK